jgi:hypothetical protein
MKGLSVTIALGSISFSGNVVLRHLQCGPVRAMMLRANQSVPDFWA